MNQTISTPSRSYVPAYSLFAQLLAQENLRIVFDHRAKTASFTPSTRVLTLPSWEGFDDATWQLFIAHEVGHALFTPANALTDHPMWVRLCALYPLNAVRTVANVFEDIRIERLVRLKYRGLSGTFSRGYHALLSKNFFGFRADEQATIPGCPIGLSETAWAARILLDRINLYAKVGTLLRVSLSSADEIAWYNRGLKTESFDDVMVLVEEVMRQLTDAQRQQLGNQQPDPSSLGSGSVPHQQSLPRESSDDADASESSKSSDDAESSDDADASESSKSSGDADASESSKSSGDADASESSKSSDDAESSDDADASDDAKSSPAAAPRDPFAVKSQSDAEAVLDRAATGFHSDVLNSNTEDLHELDVTLEELIAGWPAHANHQTSLMTLIQKFRREQSSVLAAMIATFRANQSAWQHQRVTTSRSGVIDPIKLSQYKLTEDLFLRRSALPNAQNHGFVIHVDMSGSMTNKMPVVLWQVLHLIWFADSAHIPVRVYGFSDNGHNSPAAEERVKQRLAAAGTPVRSYSTPRLLELYRSDAPAPLRQTAQAFLLSQVLRFGGMREYGDNYHGSTDGYLPKSLHGAPANEIRATFAASNVSLTTLGAHPFVGLGGTPLWAALVSSVDTVRAFRQKNRIEQCVSVWLTDGEDTHSVPISTSKGTSWASHFITEVLDPRSGLRLNLRKGHGLSELFRLHRTLTGATVICIDITDLPLRSFERVLPQSTVRSLVDRVGAASAHVYSRGRRRRTLTGRTVKQTRRRVVMTYQKATFTDAGVMLVSAREFPALGCDAYLVTHPDWWSGTGQVDGLQTAMIAARKVLVGPAHGFDADDDESEENDSHRPVRLAQALQSTHAGVAMRRFADLLVPYMASGRDDASVGR